MAADEGTPVRVPKLLSSDRGIWISLGAAALGLVGVALWAVLTQPVLNAVIGVVLVVLGVLHRPTAGRGLDAVQDSSLLVEAFHDLRQQSRQRALAGFLGRRLEDGLQHFGVGGLRLHHHPQALGQRLDAVPQAGQFGSNGIGHGGFLGVMDQVPT